MQLSPDSGSIEAAIEELKRDLPVVALFNIIKHRAEQHRPTAELSRRLRLIRAIQLAEEARKH
jgi:hypothetical protein